MTEKIDFPTVIQKFDKILARGLCVGVGKPDGQMCIEAAISVAMDLPFGDNPSCVAEAVRAFKIRLNDSPYWASPESRAAGMRNLGIAQIGSRGVVKDVDFSSRLTKKIIQRLIPQLFRDRYPDKFVPLVDRCEKEGTTEAAGTLYAAASAAADAYAASAAAYASAAAASADAYADVANAAADAADAAANAALAAAALAANHEKYLLLAADLALEALRELKSPGCEWI